MSIIRLASGVLRAQSCERRDYSSICRELQTNSCGGCIPKWGRALACLRSPLSHVLSPTNSGAGEVPSLTTDHELLITAVGRSGASALPCAGAPPPQRPRPKTCIVDLVSIFAAGAQSKESRQTTSRQSPQIPVGHPLRVPSRPNLGNLLYGQALRQPTPTP